MKIKEEAHKMKMVSPRLAASSEEERNRALEAVAKALEEARDEIFAANREDLARAKEEGISDAVYKRLKFDEGKLKAVIEGIHQLVRLPDPVGRTLLKREMDEGLVLEKISCPIGVIGVIFEARPDALVQISSLCIKSGNCAVLKGGKETRTTNKVLFDIIYKSVVDAGLPEGCMLQAELHNEIDELLECEKDVDLLIPRGSNRFVQYIMNNTKIPVMGHADGVCHVYVHKDADPDKAIPIILDAKLQYTAACNAAETLLVDRSLAESFLPAAAARLKEAGVTLRGTAEVAGFIEAETMPDEEFHREYLEPVLSLKLVDGVEEAVDHINRYGSHHTDAIITENDEAASYFMQMVDSAGVYQNCSTRFADGFRYGFGAEVGISTGKIHARGPVGLDGLMTYKYLIRGQGQIVDDYSTGKKEFHFKDLK